MDDTSKPEEPISDLQTESQNPALLSMSALALFLLLLLLPFNTILLLVGGAGGMALCERYPEKTLPRVAAARTRAGLELRSLVSRVKHHRAS